MTDAEVRRPVVAWLWGGGLLAASAVVPLAAGQGDMLGSGGSAFLVWSGRLLFAAAMYVFAFGMRGTGSVVGRQPIGVIALLVLGFVPLVLDIVISFVATESNIDVLRLLSDVQLAVTAAAALAAAIEIARARIVPGNWRWAPTIGLAIVVVLFVVWQIVGVTARADSLHELAALIAMSYFTAGVLVPLVLGVLAMLLGARGEVTASAQVYPPE